MTDLEQQIADARAAVFAADHAYQLAWGAGDVRGIAAAERSYNLAHARLGALVKRKLQRGANG
jgi:hypothetical protein